MDRSPDAPFAPPTRPADAAPDRIDAAFAVSFTHRLRFTNDVLGTDDAVLLDLLDAVPGQPARVLACIDGGMGLLADRVRELASRHADKLRLIDVVNFPGGERGKNDPRELLPVLQSILDGHIDRRSYVLAIGGGAFLDAVGLAAALAHRGVRLIRLPTTTLAQADSGVGVKNAINFFGKKNWLGTFAVPWGVINDATLLKTLPDPDWRCGFAEAVKVSLLKEPAFFERLCRDATLIRQRDPVPSDYALRRSASWHLEHITQGGDPFEHNEARPLDFGHWSAHRLEGLSGFTVRHGEAVAIGLAIDCAYSRLMHGLSGTVERRVTRCLRDLGLTLDHPLLARSEELMEGLEEFRLHLGGRLTITMLRAPGQPLDVHAIDATAMRKAIAAVHAGRTE